MSADALIQPMRFPLLGKTWLAWFIAGVLAPSAVAQWNPFSVAQSRQQMRAELGAIEMELGRLPEPRVAAQAHQRFGFHGRAGDPAIITLDLGAMVRPDEVVLFSARVSDPAPDDPVGGFPPEVRCLLSATGAEGTFVVMNEWRETFAGAGSDLPLLRLRGNGVAGRFVRLEIRGSRARARGQFFALGEIVVLEDGANRALGAAVVTGPSIETPPRWAAANLTDGFLWCGPLSGTARSPKNGFHSAISALPDAEPKWVELDLGETVALDEVRLVPARPADFADVAGFGFPPTLQVLALPAENDANAVVLFDAASTAYPNPGDAPVCVRGNGVSARRVRVVATSLWRRSDDFIFALAELQVFAGGKNHALGKTVRASDVVKSNSWAADSLVDGFGSQRDLLDWPAWLSAVEKRHALEQWRRGLATQIAAADAAFQQALVRGSLAAIGVLLFAGVAVLLGLHWHQLRVHERLRQRIARDLHDDMGSQLSHLALLAELGADGAAVTEQSESSFQAIAHGARDLQDAMRDLVWLLEPRSGEARDFAPRLRTTCQRLLAPAVGQVRIESDGEPPALTLPLEWTRDVLLFVKEALNNCARHSRAKSATIHLAWSASEFVFTLQDDGAGFDESAPDFEGGAGLRNLRQRAESLRGGCVIESSGGRGCRVELRAPLPRSSWRRWFSHG
jgi:signal transduction histidine kinase